MIPLKKWFSKHENKAEFKKLDDSRVLSSDFPGLRISTVSMASTASVASMTSTASFHKTNPQFYVSINPGTKNDLSWSLCTLCTCHPKYTAMPKRVKEGKQANTVIKAGENRGKKNHSWDKLCFHFIYLPASFSTLCGVEVKEKLKNCM